MLIVMIALRSCHSSQTGLCWPLQLQSHFRRILSPVRQQTSSELPLPTRVFHREVSINPVIRGKLASVERGPTRGQYICTPLRMFYRATSTSWCVSSDAPHLIAQWWHDIFWGTTAVFDFIKKKKLGIGTIGNLMSYECLDKEFTKRYLLFQTSDSVYVIVHTVFSHATMWRDTQSGTLHKGYMAIESLCANREFLHCGLSSNCTWRLWSECVYIL